VVENRYLAVRILNGDAQRIYTALKNAPKCYDATTKKMVPATDCVRFGIEGLTFTELKERGFVE